MDPTKWYEAPTQQYYPYAHFPKPGAGGGGDAPAPAPAGALVRYGGAVGPPGIDAQAPNPYGPHGGYPAAGAAAAEAEAKYYHGFSGGDARGLPAKDANQQYGVHPVAYGNLRKEKEVLQVSLSHEQSINAELIRRFESDAIAVSKAHSKDREYIEELENKLRNCLQEIEFLQDQLNLRNAEVDCLGEHVHSLELKLSEVSNLQENQRMLRDEVVECESHCSFLMHELEHKEAQLWKSKLHIEKLEAAISSVALESQCEVESMKLDMTALEQRCFEAERLCDQAAQEKTRMEALFEEYSVQFKEAQHTISFQEKENKKLLDKLRSSEEKTKVLLCKAHDELNVWMRSNHWTAVCGPGEVDKHLLMKLEEDLPLPNDMSIYKEVLDPFLSKLAIVTAWDENVKNEMENMSNQIRESDRLVNQLKEELREEKLRAKEEAEDLAQEMAELRYHATEMLEEESKRRASVEQASIRRIQELEAQVLKEQRKSFTAIKDFHDARDQAEARSSEIRQLKNALEAFLHGTETGISVSTESCSCGSCVFPRYPLDSPP